MGDLCPGRFHAYVERWMREGVRATVQDAREAALHYTSYENWESMPGVGVVAMLFDKPR